jgi:hypothetical protein
MRREVEEYVKQCKSCQINKILTPSTLPSALKKPPELQYNYDEYASELRGRLRTVHLHAHKNLIENKGRSKEHYDKTSGQTKLQVGYKVLLFDETVR